MYKKSQATVRGKVRYEQANEEWLHGSYFCRYKSFQLHSMLNNTYMYFNPTSPEQCLRQVDHILKRMTLCVLRYHTDVL